MLATDRTVVEWMQQLRAEYMEMPGLTLTKEQMRRLWRRPHGPCRGRCRVRLERCLGSVRGALGSRVITTGMGLKGAEGGNDPRVVIVCVGLRPSGVTRWHRHRPWRSGRRPRLPAPAKEKGRVSAQRIMESLTRRVSLSVVKSVRLRAVDELP